MGSIGAPEILVILVVALLVLGPERLPGAMRQAGRFVAEVRRIGSGFQAELRDAIDLTSEHANIPAPETTTPTSPTAPDAPPGPSPSIEPLVAPPPTARPDADGQASA